jgi:hypothetical protein
VAYVDSCPYRGNEAVKHIALDLLARARSGEDENKEEEQKTIGQLKEWIETGSRIIPVDQR